MMCWMMLVMLFKARYTIAFRLQLGGALRSEPGLEKRDGTGAASLVIAIARCQINIDIYGSFRYKQLDVRLPDFDVMPSSPYFRSLAVEKTLRTVSEGREEWDESRSGVTEKAR